MPYRKSFSFLVWFSLAYWSITAVSTLVRHAMAWNGGPHGILQRSFILLDNLLNPLPYGMISNWAFTSLCMLVLWFMYRNKNKLTL